MSDLNFNIIKSKFFKVFMLKDKSTPKSAETCIEMNQDLNTLLARLNGFFLSIAFLSSVDKKSAAAAFLKKFSDIISKSPTDINDALFEKNNEFLTNLKKSCGNKDYFTSDHKKLFQILSENNFSCVQPWMGDAKSETTLLYNDGFVIGLKFKLDSFEMGYRVDYSTGENDKDKKGLHVNFFVKNDSLSQKYALEKITPPTRYYHLPKQANSEELTKYKFWIKMTLSYLASFGDQNNSDLKTFVEKLNGILSDIDCGDLKENTLNIMARKEIRDVLIPSITSLYTKSRDKKAGRIGHYFENNQTDSEKSDSEKPEETVLKKTNSEEKKPENNAGIFSKSARNNKLKSAVSESQMKL